MKAPDFAAIAANIRPLAEFYRAHKPDVSHIFLFDLEYRALSKNPQKAARYGFKFHGKQIYFGDYQLLSDTKNV